MGIVQYGNTVIVTSIVFTATASVAVVLRLMSKRFIKAGWGADDAFIVAAIVFMVVMEGLQIWSYREGIESTSLTDPKTATYLKSAYIFACFYYPLEVCTKLSILFYYRRIFNHAKFLKIVMVMVAICIAWFLAGEAPEIFFCTPIRRFWEPTVPGTCFNYGTFWIIIMTAEVLIDLIIITLPLREVAQLQMSAKRKFLVSLIFLLGAFVIITGFIRLGVSYRIGDAQIDISQDSIWVNIHAGTAILCACLPTYRPLAAKVGTVTLSFWRSYISTSSSRGSSRGSSNELKSSDNAANPMQHYYTHQLKEPRASYRNTFEKHGSGDERFLVRDLGRGNKLRDVSEDSRLPIHGVVEETI